MGWFWAENKSPSSTGIGTKHISVGACPVKHGKVKASVESACPVKHAKVDVSAELTCPVMHTSPAQFDESACPVMHKREISGKLNPLNNIPKSLSTGKHSSQKMDLPTVRTISSIPKGSNSKEFWEYPSPQQMYNAMIRKGKIDTNTGEEIPEDAVESMVFVHNFLNEGCWQEVLEWEKPYTEKTNVAPKLLKFMGKPDQLSPRAKWYQMLGKWFPNHFYGEAPFDRHDWVILRADPTSTDPETPGLKKVRYVIDFYGGPDDSDGLPTFNLDVRPALDDASNARDRFVRYTQPIMDNYFGSSKK